MPRSRLRALILALAVCAAAGCASLTQAPRIAAGDSFGFSGRIALHEAERNLSGGIRWRHDAAGDDILLLSPLGQGVVQILNDPTGATLHTSDDKTYRAPNAEQLAWEVTGWRIPVSGLAYWVRGQAQPGSKGSMERDAHGRPLKLSQDGWKIEYTDYFDAPGAAMPRRMVLNRPEFELKLVVDNWEPAAVEATEKPQ